MADKLQHLTAVDLSNCMHMLSLLSECVKFFQRLTKHPLAGSYAVFPCEIRLLTNLTLLDFSQLSIYII